VQSVSGAWWLLVILPILFGGWNWIGGIIAWAVNKNKDPKKARSMLIWGIVISVIFIIVVTIAIVVMFALGYLASNQ
jgi:cytochrome bd-type quinol oxidase subunit 1